MTLNHIDNKNIKYKQNYITGMCTSNRVEVNFEINYNVLYINQWNPHLSKHLSTLSDMRRSIHSCSRAMSCMSLSSPCPIWSHSSRVSGSTSAIAGSASAHGSPLHHSQLLLKKPPLIISFPLWDSMYKNKQKRQFIIVL